MLSKEILEIIDRSLRDLMNNDLPFGGKLLVFTGSHKCTHKLRYKTSFATPSLHLNLTSDQTQLAY